MPWLRPSPPAHLHSRVPRPVAAPAVPSQRSRKTVRHAKESPSPLACPNTQVFKVEARRQRTSATGARTPVPTGFASARASRSQRSQSTELPLRAELFSADQMEQHGKALAAAHQLTARRAARRAAAAARSERGRAGPGLRPADRRGPREPAHHARRRMAARQLLSDRGADPHGQAAPAEGLQPRAAAARERAVGRTAARLRHRARDDLARRRPRRSGEPRAASSRRTRRSRR